MSRRVAAAFLTIAVGIGAGLAQSPAGGPLRFRWEPNQTLTYWRQSPPNPAFFTGDAYKRHLAKGEIALVLPYAWNGDSMLWLVDRTTSAGQPDPTRPQSGRTNFDREEGLVVYPRVLPRRAALRDIPLDACGRR